MKEVDRVTDPTCGFCKKANLTVLHEAKSFRLVQVVKDGQPVPGAFLAIAKKHVAPTAIVRFNPHNEVNRLRRWLIKEKRVFNIDNFSINLTTGGGERVPGHMHYWLLDRQVVEQCFRRLGVIIPNVGMYGLIEALAAEALR